MMGCDRELYFVLLLIVLVLIGPTGFMDMNYMNITYGVIIWFIGQRALLHMAKKDLYQRQLFVRSVQYKSFYSANSDVSETMPNYKRW